MVGMFGRRIFRCFLSAVVVLSLLAGPSPALAMNRGTFTVQVGQTMTLSWSTPWVIHSAAWRSYATSNVQVLNPSTFSCTIKGLAASDATCIVRCEYDYYVTSGTYTYLKSDTEDFYINVTSPAPTGVSLPPSRSVMAGSTTQLTPSVTPSGAPATFTWSSSNPSVAMVDNGLVLANNPGTTTVTVRTQNGLSAGCLVTVTQPPVTLQSASPANGAVNVARDATMTATYPTTLSQGSAFSGVKLTRASDGATVAGTASLSGSSVIFKPSQSLGYGVQYNLTIPTGAVKNQWGTANAGAAVISFTTVALDLTGSTPANGAMAVPAGDPLRLTFNAPIAAGTALGTISLVKTTTGAAVAVTPTLSGNTLTLTPATTLEYTTKYTLTVPSDALKNAAGTPYKQATRVDFTTELRPGTFAGGNGTVASPYLIETQAQLDTMREYPSAAYALAGDVALTGNWTPVNFSGRLDGRGYSITGLTVSTSGSYAGLFGMCSNAVLSNLRVVTSTDGVAASTSSGSVYAGILAAYGSVTATDCRTEGKVRTFYGLNASASVLVGGMFGQITGGSVTGCSSAAEVSPIANNYSFVGGLAGRSAAEVSDCRFTGLVSPGSSVQSSNDSSYVGGLIGYSGASIYHSQAGDGAGGGAVEVDYSGYGFTQLAAGGLVGYSTAKVYDCKALNTLTITGNGTADGSSSRYLDCGGLIGSNNAAVAYSYSSAAVSVNVTNFNQTNLRIGGFMGYTGSDSAISHCSSTGSVTSTAKTTGNYQNAMNWSGGFVGNNAGTVTNSFTIGSVTAQAAATGSNANQYALSAGFVGTNYNSGNLSFCYSTGHPVNILGASGSSTAGKGFASENNGTVGNCYYDSTTSQCSDTALGTPKTTAEMGQASTFAGWDFGNVWTIDTAKSPYPTFRTQSAPVAVTSIGVTSAGGAAAIAADKGKLQFSASATPVYATNRAVAWSVNNTALATIDQNGLLSAKANGSVTVRATAKDGSGVYGEKAVTISGQIVKVTGVALTGAGGAKAIAADDGTLQMSAAVQPADATLKTVDWSVDNAAVATISSAGLLSAKTNGTVTVRATAKDGSGVSGTVAVTVSKQTMRASNGVLWTNEGSNAIITGYNGTDGAVTIPSTLEGKTVTAIAAGALQGNGTITAVTLPAGVASIGENAFYGCWKLASMNIPAAVRELPDGCFSGTALSSVTIPAGVTRVGAAFGTAYAGQTAYACASLKAINVAVGNTAYSSRDGVLFNRDGTGLIRYPAAKAGTAYTIPATVRQIADGAFASCAGLTQFTVAAGSASFKSVSGVLFSQTGSVLVQYPGGRAGASYTVPSGVTEIGPRAFAGASAALTDVVLPTGLKRISPYAFEGSKGLARATLPDSTTEIGEGAYFACPQLKTVTVGTGVTKVGASAFEQCSKLTEAWFRGPRPTFGSGVFAQTAAGLTALYPVAQSAGWQGFTAATKQAYCYLTLNLQNGSTPKPAAVRITNGHLTAPATPTRAGYVFGGWYKQAACTSAWSFATDTVTGNVTLYAKWTNNKCTISTTANSTSYGAVAGAGSYTQGTSVTVKATPKAGYRFVRWLEGTTTVSTAAEYKFTVTKARTLKAEFAKIGTPGSAKAASAGYNSIKVSWAAVAGAREYEVYRATSSGGTYSKVGTTTATSFTNGSLTTGAAYSYKVRAKCISGGTTTYGGYSAVVSAKPIPATPGSFKAARASSTSVKVSWSAVSGATKYELYRATSKTGSYTRVAETSSLSYTNTKLTTGKTYYYKVRAYRTVSGKKYYGTYSAVVSIRP